jgi:hypothetical protein
MEHQMVALQKTSSSAPVTLVPSFIDAHAALRTGQLLLEDLDTALFALDDVTRECVMLDDLKPVDARYIAAMRPDLPADCLVVVERPDKMTYRFVFQRPDLHKALKAAIRTAEAQGRVIWIDCGHFRLWDQKVDESVTAYDRIDSLLTARGFEPLVPAEEYYGANRVHEARFYDYATLNYRCRQLHVVL